jgi:Pro-kumamolisin, activation domain
VCSKTAISFTLLKVEEFVKPAKVSVDAVNAFLESNGIKAATLSPAGDWLGFSVPVSKANEMFDANFAVYKHIATGQELIRTLSYSIPSSLKDHLDVVHPTISCVQCIPIFSLAIYLVLPSDSRSAMQKMKTRAYNMFPYFH